MNAAFVFSILASPCFSRFDSAVEASSSMGLLSLPEGVARYVARDHRFTPDDVAKEVSANIGNARVLDVRGSQVSSKNYGSYPMSMLKGAVDLMGGVPDVLVSVPYNWKCLRPVSVAGAMRVAAYRNDVLSVFLGGCPTAHVDSGASFAVQPSKVGGYLKLVAKSWDYPSLDRMACPSVINAGAFLRLCARNEQNLNKMSRCGWDDTMMVLYPDALSSRPGDGKPEPFADLVGVEPEHWDAFGVK